MVHQAFCLTGKQSAASLDPNCLVLPKSSLLTILHHRQPSSVTRWLLLHFAI